EEAPAVMRSIECRWARGRIRLDGKLEEKAWDDAVVIKDFVVFWQNRKAQTKTEARLLWDDRYLYFAADMEDADLFAVGKEHHGMPWYDDLFGVLFKPPVDKGHASPLQYCESQATPLNTQVELSLPSRGAGGYGRFGPLTNLGMEPAVRLHG